MNNPSIATIADLLVQGLAQQKTASAGAPVEPAPLMHPLAQQLKLAAEQLRALPDAPGVVVGLEDLQKIASQLGATPIKTPTLPPALKTTNLGTSAGGGGAPDVLKVASELRKAAHVLRNTADSTDITPSAAHALNAATGLQHLLGSQP